MITKLFKAYDITLIEVLAVIAIIVSVVAAITMGIQRMSMNDGTPAGYCKAQGGVPILDHDGTMTRCDFPPPTPVYRGY